MTDKIELLLADLKRNISFSDKQNANISKSNVGWHIEHSLLTLDRVIDRLSQTDSRDYKWKVSLPRLFVFTTNIIPRGRAESPEPVRPTGDITRENLTKHIGSTKEKITALTLMSPGQFFEHPYFGHLKLKQTIKFLEIHTKYHLKIIRDIKD